MSFSVVRPKSDLGGEGIPSRSAPSYEEEEEEPPSTPRRSFASGDGNVTGGEDSLHPTPTSRHASSDGNGNGGEGVYVSAAETGTLGTFSTFVPADQHAFDDFGDFGEEQDAGAAVTYGEGNGIDIGGGGNDPFPIPEGGGNPFAVAAAIAAATAADAKNDAKDGSSDRGESLFGHDPFANSAFPTDNGGKDRRDSEGSGSGGIGGKRGSRSSTSSSSKARTKDKRTNHSSFPDAAVSKRAMTMLSAVRGGLSRHGRRRRRQRERRRQRRRIREIGEDGRAGAAAGASEEEEAERRRPTNVSDGGGSCSRRSDGSTDGGRGPPGDGRALRRHSGGSDRCVADELRRPQENAPFQPPNVEPPSWEEPSAEGGRTDDRPKRVFRAERDACTAEWAEAKVPACR